MVIRSEIYILLLSMLALAFSCKHEIPSGPIPIPPVPGSTEICFESQVLPLFQSNCAKSGCHDAISRREGYQLNTYANIVAKDIKPGNAYDSKIYKMITESDSNKIMPPSPNNPLSTEQKSIIAKWINEGAKNTINCSPVCDSSQFKFASNVQPILQTHCLGCHSGQAIYGGFNPLDTYQGVKNQVTANTLLKSISHIGPNPMPKNGNKLSDCKIAIIRKWIQAGAQNN